MELITEASFRELTKIEQIVMVTRLGKELLTRVSDGFSIHLYFLSNILIEVWYETKTNNIVELKTTDKQSVIDEYIDENDIFHYLFK